MSEIDYPFSEDIEADDDWESDGDYDADDNDLCAACDGWGYTETEDVITPCAECGETGLRLD